MDFHTDYYQSRATSYDDQVNPYNVREGYSTRNMRAARGYVSGSDYASARDVYMARRGDYEPKRDGFPAGQPLIESAAEPAAGKREVKRIEVSKCERCSDINKYKNWIIFLLFVMIVYCIRALFVLDHKIDKMYDRLKDYTFAR